MVDERRAAAFCWITSTTDGQEHAVLDRDNPVYRHPSSAGSVLALCGRRITERRGSLFEPPGSRCLDCLDQRQTSDRARASRGSGIGAELARAVRRAVRMVASHG